LIRGRVFATRAVSRPLIGLLLTALAVVGSLLVTACLSPGRFRCDDDRQCTLGGQRGFCEAGQICSFEDATCALGRRYARYADDAGRLASRCLEPTTCLGTPVVELRAGGEHACYRRLDGRIACWGRNDAGQLGDGTTLPRSTPVSVIGLDGPARAVALGAAFSCAIDREGHVACWGAGDRGQLGTREVSPAANPTPVAVPGVSGALELALGGGFACVRAIDGVSCWGSNDQGQLGRGEEAAPALAPVALPLPAEQIVAGEAHACARLRDGGVACWGDGRRGQLGGGDLRSQARPVRVAGVEGVVEIAAGQAHTCARLRDGSLSCWGDNAAGQLGAELAIQPGSADPASPQIAWRPVPVTAVSTTIAVRAGARHTCAVLPDESVVCFGDANQGRLGRIADGPAAVTGVQQVLDLAVGAGFSCALERDATVRCWGEDGHGQLGAGGAIWRARPSPVPVLENTGAVAARGQATCVLRAGEVACFGKGAEGALGGRDNDDQPSPTPVRIPAGVVEIATGAAGGCARTLDRQIWCWGHGVGAAPALRSGISAADGITVGRAHACALSRGRVLCWGENRDGQLGQPVSATDTVLDPAAVPLSAVVVEVAAGDDHTCARGEAGQIFCWGRGDEGQLGGGVGSVVPIAVALPEPARALSAGAAHTCALLASGQVACWGRNRDGQLGGSSGAPVTAPLVIDGFANADVVAAGGRFTCALRDGQLACLGAGAIATEAAGASGPQLVSLAERVTAVSAGADHACVIDDRGALRCFGLDAHGQLGTGRPLFSAWPRPVAIACP
jgi:alpha-tubulin suppressor-like RCC1 family protein